MFLKGILLQHFRSYASANFTFEHKVTFIVGPNTAGKSNLVEALYLLSTGKSFRAEKDMQMISFGKEVGRVKGKVYEETQGTKETDEIEQNRNTGFASANGVDTELEVVIATGESAGGRSQSKKYLVNGVPKRRADFSGNVSVVLFSPKDLDIIIDSPGTRRDFLDSVLEQVDKEYRLAHGEYEKGIRQRNALLDQVRETGRRNDKLFEYWDDLVIKNGSLITAKRKAFIDFVNAEKQNVFKIQVIYDSSEISRERLDLYKDRECGAGVTLVGPHRDDFSVTMKLKSGDHDVREYGSRGQQRLAVVQLKILQMQYIEKHLGHRPILLLDDIFSELDDKHIAHILEVIPMQQTIITTTHKEFIQNFRLEDSSVIELKV